MNDQPEVNVFPLITDLIELSKALKLSKWFGSLRSRRQVDANMLFAAAQDTVMRLGRIHVPEDLEPVTNLRKLSRSSGLLFRMNV